MKQAQRLYFAYGSNLDPDDLLAACARYGLSDASFAPRGRAFLPDEALVFDHRSVTRNSLVLNIRRRPGAFVEGMLFEPSEAGWAALGKKEGAPGQYSREHVTVLDESGEEIAADTFRSRRSCPDWPNGERPGERYLEICRNGRARFGLDAGCLDRAADGDESGCGLVFVYGTLMTGELRASAWADLGADEAALAFARGALLDHGDYPGLVLGKDGVVAGELLRFPRIGETLARFDPIEGFIGFGVRGNFYRRVLTRARPVGGAETPAWTYVTTRLDATPIPSNDWRSHQRGRAAPAVKPGSA